MYADDIRIEPIVIKTGYDLKQESFEESISEAIKQSGYSCIKEVSGRFIKFDMSGSYWHDLGTSLWLIQLLYRFKVQGNELRLVFPQPIDSKSAKLWDFLMRWDFFKALTKCVDSPSILLATDQIVLLNRKSGYSRGSIGTDETGEVNFLRTLKLFEMTTYFIGENPPQLDLQIIISALSHLCGWDASTSQKFINRVLREGINNSFLHAHGTFVNVAFRVDNKNLILAISDNGAGIPSVLRTALQENEALRTKLQSDTELIQYFAGEDIIIDGVVDSKLIGYATEDGITSDQQRSGAGLHYLKSIVLKKKGELSIRSGTACVNFTPENTKPKDDLLDSPGTLLRIKTPLRET